MTRLYLIRHAQAQGNIDRVFQGRLDGELSARGQEQIKFLARRCKEYGIQAIYSSPLIRAYETAKAVNEYYHLPIFLKKEIIEIDGGYYIFYCSSAFDAELTEAHKMDVLEKRMSDAVTDTYADYMSQLSSKENQDGWSEVTVDTSLKLESASFMEVYQQYFSAKE